MLMIDEYLYDDIIMNLLRFLNKDSSFTFLNTCKQLNVRKVHLYSKYEFYSKKIVKSQYRDLVKHVIICDSFKASLDNLPKNLVSIRINAPLFNHKLDNLPNTLESLFIKSDNFDQQMDKLPQNLTSLELDCYKFNKLLDKLPPTLKSLKIKCILFDKPLNNLPLVIESVIINSWSYMVYNIPFPSKIPGLKNLVINDIKIK